MAQRPAPPIYRPQPGQGVGAQWSLAVELRPGPPVYRPAMAKPNIALQQMPAKGELPGRGVARPQSPALHRPLMGSTGAPAPHLLPKTGANGRTIQRALWVLSPDETTNVDLKKLQGVYAGEREMKKIPGVGTPDISTSLAEAGEQAQHYQRGEKTFHVLSHAGLVPEPWVGGLLLEQFADKLVAKYGAHNLEGGEVVLMVCLIGRDKILTSLLERLHNAHEIQDLSIYAPVDYMWISSLGKPHVAQKDVHNDTDRLNEQIAKYSAEIDDKSDLQIQTGLHFENLGNGWAGARLQGGTISTISSKEVSNFIKERFGTEEDFDDYY